MARKPQASASPRAALGLRAHTGWAALVALGGPAGAPQVLDRQRLILEDPTGEVARFCYHVAADAPAGRAEGIIATARAAAETAADAAIGRAIDKLRGAGFEVVAGVVLTGAPVPQELEAILAAHPLIHAAEGALYREALMAGCRAHDLPVVTIRERELWRRAQPALGRDEAAVQASIDALGRAAGRPWGQDQKMAAAAAWIALN
jgi:hypothetical protein